jgi:hypothetical protein
MLLGVAGKIVRGLELDLLLWIHGDDCVLFVDMVWRWKVSQKTVGAMWLLGCWEVYRDCSWRL